MLLKLLFRCLPVIVCLFLVVTVGLFVLVNKRSSNSLLELKCNDESAKAFEAGYRMVQFTRITVQIR
jgi:hypothetical protein